MVIKKYVIIGAVIVAVIGGIIFFFSRNNTSVPDAVILEKGVKNLTREKAAEMIKAYFKTNPPSSKSEKSFVCNKQPESSCAVVELGIDVKEVTQRQ
ncbi:MAG: hypothetical protein V1905_03530 [bacterium]